MGREEVKSIKTKIQKDCSFLDRDESDVKLEYSQGIVEDAIKPEEKIEQVMPDLTITIYSTPSCNKCRMLMQFLNENHIAYEEKDASANYDEIKNSIFTSAPIIRVIKGGAQTLYDMDMFMDFLRADGII